MFIIRTSSKLHMNNLREKWVGRIGEDVYDNYIASLLSHLRYVKEAGERLGVNEDQLLMHDQSKFLDLEFGPYAIHFYGGGGNDDDYAKAWLHHIHHNPHHWQHWIFSDGFTPPNGTVEGGVIEMPGKYVIEMIADWMGASMAYTGSWDMSQWLFENMPRIRVHSKTAALLRDNLDALGYADVVYTQRFHKEVVGND